MPANRTKTGQFQKGSSGNPSGRPKRSDAETEALAAICTLAPMAVEVMREILEDSNASSSVRLRCAESVLERVCGKPLDPKALSDYETTPVFDFSSFTL